MAPFPPRPGESIEPGDKVTPRNVTMPPWPTPPPQGNRIPQELLTNRNGSKTTGLNRLRSLRLRFFR